MISTAFVVALLVLAGFIVLFYKLPEKLREFLSRRYLLLDVLICIVAFWALSFTLIGIVAAGFISLFVSLYLLWYKKSTPKNTLMSKQHTTRSCPVHIRTTAWFYNLVRWKK